jgi:hypothetical protein
MHMLGSERHNYARNPPQVHPNSPGSGPQRAKSRKESQAGPVVLAPLMTTPMCEPGDGR